MVMTDKKLTDEQEEMWEKLKTLPPHSVNLTFQFDYDTKEIIINSGYEDDACTVQELYSFLKKEWEDD
jgi:hypothetical protein